MMNNPMMGVGNMMGMLSQLKANPMQFLMQRRFNLPQGVAVNDPNAILNHLLQTGQITQAQVNAAYQQMGQFR